MADFEFSGQHEAEFKKAGYWMSQAGLLAMFVGALQALGALLSLSDPIPGESAYAGIISGAVYIVLGLFTRRSGKSFAAIATSEGQDMPHLLSALVSLKQLFRIMVLGIVLIFLVTVVAAFAVGFLAGAEG